MRREPILQQNQAAPVGRRQAVGRGQQPGEKERDAIRGVGGITIVVRLIQLPQHAHYDAFFGRAAGRHPLPLAIAPL